MNDGTAARMELNGRLEREAQQISISSQDALLTLDTQQIEQIARAVPGGSQNVQDVYPLSPLQEGMLFHRLLNADGDDTYVLSVLFELHSQADIAPFVAALQSVVDRHDALRTAILWEDLPQPVQVVWRRSTLRVEQLTIDADGDLQEQLDELLRPQRQRMNLQKAPLMSLQVTARDHRGRWFAILRVHHAICDHGSLQVLVGEALAFLRGSAADLPAPISYGSYIAESRLGMNRAEAEAFFTRQLAHIDEPTAPFGLTDARGDGSRIAEARGVFDAALAMRVRAQSSASQVSVARLFHAAWALVVARTSGRDDVVFGTVLLAAQQRRARGERALGMAVNTLPLRLRLHDLTASQLVEQVDLALTELTQHEKAPLTMAQRCSSVAATAPLFTALLNYRRNSPPDPQSDTVARVRVLARGEAWTNYPLTLIIDDLGETFALTAQTDRRIDPNRLLAYVEAATESLIEALRTDPQAPALTLSMLPPSERHQLLHLFNATQLAYPSHKLIHELFEEQVERTPHAVAVSCGEQFLTYRHLNLRANQLAHYLKQLGAQPDCFVGLCVERGIDMLVGVLGILKAGAAYVPLDPGYPAQRLEYMLRDTCPLAVLTQERLKSSLPSGCTMVALDEQWSEISQCPAMNPSREGSRSAHLAYVIYTSGSTGQPKGVAIEHRNAVNLICWAHAAMPAEVFDQTLHSTSLNFDLSVYELFVPLTNGGALRVVANALALATERAEVTLINTVPSAIKGILDCCPIPETIQVVNLAGEALKGDLVERIFANSAVREVCNLYGPSETTTYSTWICMPRAQGFVATIGRPIANTQVYVLDRRRQLAPLGVEGEIYIGGAGVARGYLNRPELTTERFLPDPFGDAPQARMYRTGDLGRWRMDGQLEYLGRNDHQVKIRGFRIELGEIESHLARHEQLQEAAVLAREDIPGEKRLVAYVVARDGAAAPSPDELRAHLKGTLPEHMVPSAFMTLERLPLTPNGKLDRSALPSLQQGAYLGHAYEPPRGEVEEILAGIWCTLLQVDRVGRRDSFFELGGHSLLIVQVLDRLRRAGLSVDMRRVFENPTLRDLARAVTAQAREASHVPPNRIPPACTTITPAMLPLVDLDEDHLELIARSVPGGFANIQDIYPLVPLQEGILFHHLLDQAGDTYVLPAALEVSSRARLDELIAALHVVIDRHDVLRTAVLWEGLPRPVQVVLRHASLPVTEIALDPQRPVADQIQEWLEPGRQRMELQRAPLLQLRLAADPHTTRWYALLQLHHMVIDHVTLELLTAEVVSVLEDRAQDLPAPVPYREHVAQAVTYARTGDAETFFRSRLADADEPTAPFGLLDVYGDGTQIEEAREDLDTRLAQRIRTQARRLGVGAATLFHVAWGMVVAHTSGRDDIVFGSLLLGRLHGDAGAQRMLGVFINTLPLRLQLQDVTAKQIVERAQSELVELLTHEQASLAVAQRCSRIPASAPLFTALLNYRHSVSTLEAQWSTAREIRMLALQERTNYPVTLSVDDLSEGFTLNAQTDRRVDPRRITGYVHTAMRSLVEALEQDASTPVLALSILPDSERHQLVDVFNATRTSYGRDELIHQLFEAQVARAPDATAVIFEDQALTYRELNARANQLAHYLRGCGVRQDELVGICAERSLEMVVGLLGVLKAGAAYVPLDPSYPPERLAYMIEDARPAILLTQDRLRTGLPQTAARVVSLDAQWHELAAHASENLDPRAIALCPQHLAYVIYTSGSTGRPKGAMNEHRAVVNRLRWMQDQYQLGAPDRVLQKTPFSFDVSVWEFFWTLMSGAQLIVARPRGHQDPDYLRDLIEQHGITTGHFVPSMLQLFLERLQPGQCMSLQHVVCSGEELPAALQRRFFKCLPHARLSNLYGPTEAAVDVTAWECRADDEGRRVPIGRPIANTRMYVLDRRGQPTPFGVAGEIHIGGTQVGRGYLHRPALTAERFVPDPFVEAPARLYRTGDLGRWRADGALEYLGRNDHQVKIRGFRIELGEIETVLASEQQIREAAVLAREDAPGEKQLVAYIVPSDPCNAPGAEELRAALKRRLPDYMMPSAFVTLERLPLSPNGKLDRRALPAPQLDSYVSRAYEPPQGEVEQVLAGIWSSLLRLERVGRRDNFFELGGHSLLIVHLMERLRHVGLFTDVRKVFNSATLADLARALRGGAEQAAVPANSIPPGCEAITPAMLPLVDLQPEHIARIVGAVPGGAANVQDIYPLAPLQEGILFHHLLDRRGGDVYVVPILLSVSSRERLDDLIAALQTVIDRHDILRTAMLWEQLPAAVQVVQRRVTLPVENIALDPQRGVAEQLQDWVSPERQWLDLRQAPLLRLQVARDPHGGQWYAMLRLHHIVGDNTSHEIIASEVVALLEGRAQQLRESVPYRNHVAQALAYARSSDATTFFRSKLATIDEPTAPFGILDVRGDGSRIEEAQLPLSTELARLVRAQAQRLGVSAATLFHAAWALVVARTSGRDDVVFGSVLLGRLHGDAGAQQILGMFINTLPLRLQLRGTTVKELVEQTQRELVELLCHEQASLALAQRCSGLTGAMPLFTSLFNYRHSIPNPQAEWSAARGIQMLETRDRTNYPIAVSVDDLGDGFVLSAQTDRRISPQRLTGYLEEALQRLVQALQAAPRTPALLLPILPASERRQLLEVFNDAHDVPQHDGTIHAIFEEQVKRTPDALALTCDGESLTYAQLNSRANQLAHWLREQGVAADQLVGLCLERSIEMMVSVLATWKAGGAYVPLDPSYPPERLQHMLSDAQLRTVVIQERLRHLLQGSTATILAVDTEWQQLIADSRACDLEARELPPSGGQLAYVIYTSGSTGLPKGVMIEHRAVLNLWHGLEQLYPASISGGRAALNASFSFDASVQQFVHLLAGRSLCIVPQEARLDAALLLRFIAEHRIDVIDCTPSQLKAWIAAGLLDGSRRAPQVVLVGGEAIDAELWRTLAQCPSTQFHNVYGPTECTVDATTASLRGDETSPHIGRPMMNRRVHILDRHGELAPIGVAGEICIAGSAIARGYLNRPELTAERFEAESWRTDPGARMYRTGDMGRWRADGVIEYLGRNDNQVKIRGFRIELGEIEAQLLRHEQVRSAVVVADERAAGDKRLIAYVVPVSPADLPSVESLRSHLQEVLPQYMVPGALVLMERMPLTGSGKVDRRALPAPELTDFGTAACYEAPQGEMECTLAAIWQELLAVERVGRDDNFFDLGGHSLLAMQVLARLQSRHGIELPMRLMFELPSVRALSAGIEELRRTQTEDLLEQVASMSDSEVQELMRRLTTERV